MLHIKIPEREFFDDNEQCFINFPAIEFDMEHSLLSVSKWESKWHKPFINSNKDGTLSDEELLDYFSCMTISNKKIDPMVYRTLPADVVKQIDDYIGDTMTATWFNDENTTPSREIITSEVIYYMMIELGIPSEYQKWHLNRLMTLIRVCSIKKSPPKKMSNQQILERNKRLNEERLAKMKTSG